MQWKSVFLAGVLAAALAPVALTSAQSTSLDPTADPNFGSWPLAEFPDPFILTVQAGGDVNAAQAGLPAGCTGYVTSPPDIVLDHAGGALRTFFAAEGDTTLIMFAPDGSTECSDDVVGTNPMIDLPNAAAGQYTLWIGTFSEGAFEPGYLVVTSGQSQPGALIAPLLGGGTASTAPNNTGSNTATPPTGNTLEPNSPATFATLPIGPGFQPDPTEVVMNAGGIVDVTTQGLGADCRGFVAAPPDVSVAYTAPGRFLRVFFQAADDTTLVVGLPDGSFLCNDDFSGSLDPLVDITAPAPGLYNIWVGTFGPGATANGTLYLTSCNTADPTNTQ
jgi:hypothetical protein